MLSLILAESSLELVPKEIQQHPAVLSHAKKLGKKPSEILLDNSWDYAAMKGIKNEIKRGRPDLLHLCLLQSCSIPLYHEDKIRIYIHTIGDKVITVGQNVRLPKSYHRFLGLIEKLYKEKSIKAENETLLELKEMSLPQLIDKISPKQVIGLSTEGESSTYSDVVAKLDDDSCLVVGGFQKGHFFDSTKNRFDKSFKVDRESLDAHVVIGRTLYEYEKTIFM
jgi:rRNA small subunit pseudouridine methyltransferase Nep1